ncbi:Uncharacterised protein [Klebsiella pneumoniae subsp. ozaenae]|uniref:Uncharacterized protein n=1 Tax=Klebsiella pneumoniae subsp. ozaenae TaxID=574 RepID=A0A378C6N8_KLEPO|nr:Uncharacterised protein [Klebsiella pneumoniae subsp. ozaenae]
MNIPQTRYIYKREAHPWMMHKVKIKQWHPIRVALLFRLGPKNTRAKIGVASAMPRQHVKKKGD